MILYHTTSLDGAEAIKDTGLVQPKNFESFVSFSEDAFTGDISANDVTLRIEVDPSLVEKVEYTKRWYKQHPDQASYVAGEGWREQFVYPDDIYDEEGETDPELEEQAFQEAELESFLYKSNEQEWISKTPGVPVPVQVLEEVNVKRAKALKEARARFKMKVQERLAKRAARKAQLMSGPAAPKEVNPNSYDRHCYMCGWDSEFTGEEQSGKCPKCGAELKKSGDFALNTAPGDTFDMNPTRSAQAKVPENLLENVQKALTDAGIPGDQVQQVVENMNKLPGTTAPTPPTKPNSPQGPNEPNKTVTTNTVAPTTSQPIKEILPGKPLGLSHLQSAIRMLSVWGEPGRINSGPGYDPPAMAEVADQEIDTPVQDPKIQSYKEEVLESAADLMGIPLEELKEEVRGVMVFDFLKDLEKNYPQATFWWGSLERLRNEVF